MQTVHKEGYLFKQGSYFSSWTEKFFVLETSILKQFTDSDSDVPSYSMYLGSMAVEGIFSAESNNDLGYGKMWSLVIRWPLPVSEDMLEQEWGFMHIGSHEEKCIDEWKDSLVALIKVEQSRKEMLALRKIENDNHYRMIMNDSSHPKISISEKIRKEIPIEFSNSLDRLVANFNTPLSQWVLKCSNDGMLFTNHINGEYRFAVAFPPSKKITNKRIWETILSQLAVEWNFPGTICRITDQGVINPPQILTDTWTIDNSTMYKRVAFQDDSVFFVLATAALDKYIGWTVHTVGSRSVLNIYFPKTNDPYSITRGAAIRIKEFIIS